jgi:hypothetical protein
MNKNLYWTLERKCTIRQGYGWRSPEHAYRNQLHPAITYRENREVHRRRKFDLSFEDIVPLGWGHTTIESKSSRQEIYFPVRGYILSQKYPHLVNAEGLESLCRNCPANTSLQKLPAGCTGRTSRLSMPNYWNTETSEEEDWVHKILQEMDVIEEFTRYFPQTKPMWYGLWMISPIPLEALPLFLKICQALKIVEEPFLRAIEMAYKEQIPLHIKFVNEGFNNRRPPVCYVCKAPADTTKGYVCPICSTISSPRSKYWVSRKRKEESEAEKLVEYQPHKDSFFNLLPRERYRKLIQASIHLYEIPEDEINIVIEQIIEKERTQPERYKQERILEIARQKQQDRESVYLEKVLFCYISRRNTGIGASFRAPKLRRVLERAKDLNITVTAISHYPEYVEKEFDAEHFQIYQRGSKPEDKIDLLLAEWVKEGCDGWFYAYFDIPESALLAFEKGLES